MRLWRRISNFIVHHLFSRARKNETRGLIYDRSVRISTASTRQRRNNFVRICCCSFHHRAYRSRTSALLESTHNDSPVSASTTRTSPLGDSAASRGSYSRTAIKSCFLAAILSASSYPSFKKSEIKKAMLRFLITLVRYRSPSAMFVCLCTG